MARVIEAVQIFKKVEDVTAAKDDPPPVYLMDELAEMARGSFESSEKIADRIAKRLQNKSPTVKFKALRLTRHVCNKGGGHFKRAMQKHTNLVRDLTHYNGEPDPLKGDALNSRVRDAAKEASEALFNTVMQQPVNSLGSRIQGFGSAAAPVASGTGGSGGGGYASAGNTGGSGGADRSSSSRMGGFGNSGAGGGYTAPNIPASSGSGTGFGNFGGQQRGVNRPLTGGYGDSGGPTLPTTNSGGYGGTGGYGGAGGYGAPTPVHAAGVLGSEEQLVDSICTPAGLRLAPEQEDLRRFVEAVGSLDGLKVAELLRDKMDGSSTWQQLLRALYALEAILQHGASQACGEIAVMFQSDPGPVQAAAMHPQATVKERANRVLRQLLGDSAGAAAPQAAASAPARQQAPPPPQQQQANLVDLLGGSPAKPQQQQQQYAGVAPLGIATAGSGDMFSGLAVPGGPEVAPQAYQVLQQQQQQQAYHGGLAPPPVAAPRPAAAPDLLGLDSPLAASARPAQPVMGPTANGAYPQQGLGGGTGAGMGLPLGPGMGTGVGMAPGPQVGGHQAGMPPVQPLGPAQPQSQAQGSQQRNLAAPLDDLFSDMSLSGASHQPAAAGRMGGAAGGPGVGMGAGGYGGYGQAASGGVGGMAGGYGGIANGGMATGGGGAGMSYSTLAGGPSGAGTPSAVASGYTTPTLLGSQAGSAVDLLGLSGAAGAAGPYAANGSAPMSASGSMASLQQPMVGSGVGTPTAGSSGHMNQYGGAGALLAGGPGQGGMMLQQQQQQYRPPHQGAMPLAGSLQAGAVGGMPRAGAGGSATDLLGLGGHDIYGASSAPGGGPQMGMSRGAGAGMGMGMGAAPGMGMTGGAGMGGGMGMGAGGMMVAPGGQVQYVPQQQHGMGPGMGPGGGMGPGAGGGAYGMQQHLGQVMGAGPALGGQQGHGKGGPDASAFDFVMDSFGKR